MVSLQNIHLATICFVCCLLVLFLSPLTLLLELLVSVCCQNLFFLIFPFFQMKCVFSVNVKTGAIRGKILHFPLSSKDTISSPQSHFPPLLTVLPLQSFSIYIAELFVTCNNLMVLIEGDFLLPPTHLFPFPTSRYAQPSTNPNFRTGRSYRASQSQ